MQARIWLFLSYGIYCQLIAIILSTSQCCFQSIHTLRIVIPGVALPQVKDHLPDLIELHKPLHRPSPQACETSSLSSSTMNCTPQFGITCRLASVPLSMPLIKILNKSGPSVDPLETALSTVFHLAMEPLIISFQIWPVNLFCIHLKVHSSHPCLSNLVARMSWGTILKALEQMRFAAVPLSTDAVTPSGH